MSRMRRGTWIGFSMALFGLSACSQFVAADSAAGGETSTGSDTPGDTGAVGPETSSTSLGSGGVTGSTSGATGSGPDPSEAEGGDEDSQPSSSTSGGPASTTGGVDPSSSGGESSTGEVPLTCADLVLPETGPVSCSTDALDLVELAITNDCAGPAVDVYWVDYNCNEIFYARIQPGGSWGIPTFQTHPWRVRNVDTGALMREIPPLLGDTTLSVLQR